MAKRLKGEGSIIRRNDGRYQFAAMVNGRRQYLYGKSPEEIVAKAEEMKKAIREGKLVKKTKLTVADWLGEWLDKYCVDIKQSTWDGYENNIRLHLIPFVGKLLLHKITTDDIQTAFNKMASEGRSPRTIQLSGNILAAAFSIAEKQRYMVDNPAHGVKRPKVIAKSKRLFTDEEAAKMLTEINRSNSVFADVAIVAWESMCRISEVLGLKWIYVDSDGIRIEEALSRVGSRAVDSTPKSGSNRKVYLSDECMKLITKQSQKGPYVFHTKDGKYLSYRNFLREWRIWLGRAFGTDEKDKPLLNVTPHAMRHAAATKLIESGNTMADVQERGGWRSPSMLVKIYANHTNKERQKQMAEMAKIPLVLIQEKAAKTSKKPTQKKPKRKGKGRSTTSKKSN